ncbi:MAG: hypothetical protein GY811_05505 [Myxococcales bacterium]|nr:hypothetical protein [Myxococcales bacterium]
MNDASAFESALQARSGSACELCGAGGTLSGFEVLPAIAEASPDRCIYACETCLAQYQGTSDLESKHWFCLRDSIWSEVAAVQVIGYRILKRLEGEGWAQDLLGQIYLMEDVQAWADAVTEVASGDGEADEVVTLDSNGAQLFDGDSVTLIKDLDVKGAGFVAKRGTMVRNIHLIGDPGNIEGKVNKIALVLNTKFLKRVA